MANENSWIAFSNDPVSFLINYKKIFPRVFYQCYCLNPLNTDKLRINATFRQKMAFFGHFRPNFVPILEKSAF